MNQLRLLPIIAVAALAACNSTPIVRAYSSSAGIPRHVRLTRTRVKLVTTDMLPPGADGRKPMTWDRDSIALNVLSATDRDLQGAERRYVLIAPWEYGDAVNAVDNVDVTRAAFVGLDEAKLLKQELDGIVAEWDRDDPPGQRTFFAMTSTSEDEVRRLSPNVVEELPSVRLFVNRSERSKGKPAALFLFHRERVGGGGFEDHRLSLTEKGKVARFATMLGVAIADLESAPAPTFGPGAISNSATNPVRKP